MNRAPPSKDDILCRLCAILSSGSIDALLANETSIIPVWMAETIKGWNGRSNVDAAIRNFGFSSRSALDKHCMKGVLSKCPTHQIFHINHPSFCISTSLKKGLVNAAIDSIHKNLHVHTNLKHESSNWYWYILKDSYLADKPNQVGHLLFMVLPEWIRISAIILWEYFTY